MKKIITLICLLSVSVLASDRMKHTATYGDVFSYKNIVVNGDAKVTKKKAKFELIEKCSDQDGLIERYKSERPTCQIKVKSPKRKRVIVCKANITGICSPKPQNIAIGKGFHGRVDGRTGRAIKGYDKMAFATAVGNAKAECGKKFMELDEDTISEIASYCRMRVQGQSPKKYRYCESVVKAECK